MSENTLETLNNHLFQQLGRLNKADSQSGELQTEIERAKAVAGIASQIISNGALSLKATHLKLEFGLDGGKAATTKKMPKMLRDDFLGDGS
jgi:hypothetical protein